MQELLVTVLIPSIILQSFLEQHFHAKDQSMCPVTDLQLMLAFLLPVTMIFPQHQPSVLAA